MNRNPSDPGRRHYDETTIWLHWMTVALVVALWVIGQTADYLPRGPFRGGVWSVHVLLGCLLAVVLPTRIAWRAHFGRILPPADSGVLYLAAKATHRTLYVLLALAIASGVINASYRGFNLFGIWSVPQFGSADAATRRSINGWHELAADLTLLVALFHMLAALFHQYVWRDRLLDRMVP